MNCSSCCGKHYPSLYKHYQAGRDEDHIKVFATIEAAEKWFEENDPEGVAFEYEAWSETRKNGRRI
ncbi:hypothetical protein ACVME8_010586 [Bradyrhizobium diazoefficiens]